MLFGTKVFSFLALATATFPGVVATNLHNPDTNPKLKVLEGSAIGSVVNWTGAFQLCRDQYSRALATPEEVCALKELEALEESIWIPVRKPAERNAWVRVGGGEVCQEYKDLHTSTLVDRQWTEPSWGTDNAALPFENAKVLCASVPEAPEFPQTCASVWGDPHITTWDGARYDVQGDGDFVLAQSLDSGLDVQGRFVGVEKISVMRGFHIWTGRDDEPHVEVSFKTNNCDDSCKLQAFIDGNYVDLDRNYIAYGTYATKSTGVHFIKSGNTNRWFYFPSSGITVHFRFNKSERFGCQFTYKLCVPNDIAFNENFVGLLGTPNGDHTDEWMAPDGAQIEMPTSANDLRYAPAFNYAHTNWCIRDSSRNNFWVSRSYMCDVAYDSALEEAVAKVSDEVKLLCGDDLACILDGTIFSWEGGNPDGLQDSVNAIMEERVVEEKERAEVTEDSEFEAEQIVPDYCETCPKEAPGIGTICSFEGKCPYETITCCDGSKRYTAYSQCIDGLTASSIVLGACSDVQCPLEQCPETKPEPQALCNFAGQCAYGETMCCDGTTRDESVFNCVGGKVLAIANDGCLGVACPAEEPRPCPTEKPETNTPCNFEGPCHYDEVECCDGSRHNQVTFQCNDGIAFGFHLADACYKVECPVCATDTKICEDGTEVTRTGPNCEFECPPCDDCETPVCPTDTKMCPDGSMVGRSGPDCEFRRCLTCATDTKICEDGTEVLRTSPHCEFECPPCDNCTKPVCPADTKMCPDGTMVGRSGPDCEFRRCLTCATDTKICEDGTEVTRTGPHCEFECPPCDDCETPVCPTDTKMCPDGTMVGRSGPDCEFRRCLACATDTKVCEDGTEVSRTGPHCEFECPPCDDCETPVCPTDTKTCPDGTMVGRAGPDCEFKRCLTCATDTKTCPGGTVVERSGPNCEFPECPPLPPDEPSPEDRTTTTAFTRGDPHFKTFGGELYDYHGECDLVLLHNPDFKEGLGMDIHIRTKIEAFWSSVQSAVIKLGAETMEIQADPQSGEWLWFNGQEATSNIIDGKWVHGDLAGFLVRYKQTGPNTREANLYLKGAKEVLIMKTFKSFVRIDVNWQGSDNYYNSVGMLGSHAQNGRRLGRDGVLIESTNDFGQEWQVRPEVDGLLFHSYQDAVVGKKCILPPSYNEGNTSTLRGRRLGASSLDTEAAEKACNHLVDPEERKACVYDVVATQDLNMASAW